MIKRYYKNPQGELFVNPILANHVGLTRQTKSQFKIALAEQNKPTTEQLLRQLTQSRKKQERQGVTLNGIRYAGDPGNRQALQEAIAFMEDADSTEFPKWKDSDGQFHVDHPLADVLDAYRAIGIQRVTLIATEGNHASKVISGKLTDLKKVKW